MTLLCMYFGGFKRGTYWSGISTHKSGRARDNTRVIFPIRWWCSQRSTYYNLIKTSGRDQSQVVRSFIHFIAGSRTRCRWNSMDFNAISECSWFWIVASTGYEGREIVVVFRTNFSQSRIPFPHRLLWQ